MSKPHFLGFGLLLAAVGPTIGGPAAAQQPAPTVTTPHAAVTGLPTGFMPQVEVQDMVLEALKSDTTVQEAPGIISVITDEQMRDLGHRELADVLGDVPGFFTYGWVYSLKKIPIGRGVLAGVVPIRDGLDLYDAGPGVSVFDHTVPIQTLKRIEVTSGPGGVLWGSNSFVGVINMVSKTADDFQGVEARAGWGTGPGNPDAVNAYVMAGEKLFGNRLKIFAHASYQTFRAPELDFPFYPMVRANAPQPQAPALLGPAATSYAARSHVVVANGNAQFGPVSLHWHVPWAQQNRPASFGGTAVIETLGEDSIDCTNPANAAICALRVDPKAIARKGQFGMYDQYGLARYTGRFFGDRLGVEARGYYVYFRRPFEPYVAIPPSSLLPDGVVASQDFSSHRVGMNLDNSIALPGRTRLLFGGEVFYDYLPPNKANFFTGSATLGRLPFQCPAPEDGKVCPLLVSFESDRLTGGIFADAQTHYLKSFVFDGGVRVQLYGGKRRLDPVVLGSGAAVWSFLPNWNLKVNFAQGFRPPSLQKTDSNGEALAWAGNTELEVERSQAVQGEINARLLHDYKFLRRLALRADYSYTWVSNFIDVTNGIYRNVARLGIHSAELMVDLSFKKGHWVGFGYTFLDMASSDKGKVRSIPNQWFNARARLDLWKRKLFLTTDLSVFGSCEDVNRYPAQPGGSAYLGAVDERGQPTAAPTFAANATDVTVDQISPYALWNAGLRYLFNIGRSHFRLSGDVYNLLDARGHFPEGFMDPSAGIELTPNPREGISFFLSLAYSHL
jgi:outer membrane receptor protein involved in Fe transport